MAGHNEIGKQGEGIACEFLKRKGYVIVWRNYRTKRAEIDIIARHKGVLVFVEVRSKQHEWFGSPEHTINTKKIARLKRNAIAYAHRERYQGPCRVDAICLAIGQTGIPSRICHYENIVET